MNITSHSGVKSVLESSVSDNILGLLPEQPPLGRALVIQDNRHLARLLPIYLDKMRLEAVYADNAYDGYKNFLTGRFDMILADLGVMGAWTMVCHFKQHYPATPVMLFFDRIGENLPDGLMDYDIDAWLVKPFGLFALRDRFRQRLNIIQSQRALV